MFRDTIQYTISKIVPAVAGVLMVVVFVRMVGNEQYGRFSLFYNLGITAGTFATGWLNQAQLRYHGAYESYVFEKTVRQGVTLASLLVVLLIAIGIIVNSTTRSMKYGFGLALAGVLAIVFMTYNAKITTFRARILPSFVAKLEIVRAAFAIGAPIALVVLVDRSYCCLLAGVMIAYLVPLILSGRINLPVTSTRVAAGKEKGNSNILLEFWKFGWPLSLWLGVMSLFQVTDRYLIQYFYGFQATGVYSSIYDLVFRSCSLIFFPVTMAAHPRIMEAWNSDRPRDAISLIRWALLFQLAAFIPTITLIVFLRPEDVGKLLPEGGGLFSEIAIPIAIAGFLWQVALIVHKPLEVMGKTKTMLTAIIASFFVFAFLNLWGLPRYGLVTAAYSMLSAGLVYILACLFGSLKWGFKLARAGEVSRKRDEKC